MKNKLYEEIRQGKKEPCGVYAISNFGGLAIYDINDKAVSGFDFGDGVKHIRTTQIYYTLSGRAYIIRYGMRYYFDNIVRV